MPKVKLKARWEELEKRVGMPINWSTLESGYSRPQRHYHGLIPHIEQCLNEFDIVKHLVKNNDELEIALWFHDIVYDPTRQDNQERSFGLLEVLTNGNKSLFFMKENIHRYILATKHNAVSEDMDSKLIADIDLSILGKPHEEFLKYEHEIKEEYKHIAPEDFKKGRAVILQRFLDRKDIYQTEFFRKKYEERARTNLNESLKKLK